MNYHRLTHANLEKWKYRILAIGFGDNRLRSRPASQAVTRSFKREALHERLKLILEGEPPYDIFVRWNHFSYAHRLAILI